MKSLLDLLQIIYAQPRERIDSAHKREITDARMLRIYCTTQAKRATEQRFRLKPASVYPVICMDRYTIRVLKVSKYIQHFIANKARRACEIVHLQQFTREYRRRRAGFGYNRYISTLSDVPLAFLLIYGLLRSRRRRRRRASARKFF